MSDSSFVFLFPLSLPHLGCPRLKSIIPKILLYSYCFSAQEFKRTPFDPLFKPKLSLWHWKPFNSVQFSCSVMSNSLWPHGLKHTSLPCPSPIPRAYSNSCPSSRWCISTISSSVIPFSSCLQSFPASGSFLMSWLFTPGGQSTGVSASASVLPMNIQDWFPLAVCT